jgi:hypothetical protein
MDRAKRLVNPVWGAGQRPAFGAGVKKLIDSLPAATKGDAGISLASLNKIT